MKREMHDYVAIGLYAPFLPDGENPTGNLTQSNL